MNNKRNNSLISMSFSPDEMLKSELLITYNDIHIVDREQLKKNYPNRDFFASFCRTLHGDYNWSFDDFNKVTVYYKYDKDKAILYGGVFHYERGVTTKKVIFSFGEKITCNIDYVYSELEIQSIMKDSGIFSIYSREADDNGYLMLACAVILQAMEDYTETGQSEKEKNAILKSLRGDNPILQYADGYASLAAFALEENEEKIRHNINKLYNR